MKPKELKPHAVEMLRLISARSIIEGPERRYWTPTDKSEFVCDGFGTAHIFVSGPWSTGAIRTLTTRGLVEVVEGSMDKWARRITAAGRTLLAGLLEDHKVEAERSRLARDEEMQADGW